jgi:hypothetical protein
MSRRSLKPTQFQRLGLAAAQVFSASVLAWFAVALGTSQPDPFHWDFPFKFYFFILTGIFTAVIFNPSPDRID